MALVLEQINVEGLAQLSYLVGDDKAGVAVIIDPRRDVDIYIQRARELGVKPIASVETHIHADFVSGSHELRARLGIPIYGGKSDDYQFDLHQLQEGDTIEVGSVTLRALHTPGHTPEHISLLIHDAKQGKEPFGLFTGDTLFNLDVGRPDLLGGGTEKRLARELYRSLFEKILPLGDRIEVYPCHGAGSSCGKSIGDRRHSTIGNERLFNPALQERSEDEFVDWLLGDMPEPPRHYARLKKINAKGAPVVGCLPTLQPLSASEFRQKMDEENTLILDTRSILAFGGGHVRGAINIALRPAFPNWVGWMIPPERSLLVIVESERDVKLVTEQLFRVGYDHLAGYLHDGMTSWQDAGLPLERVTEWTVHDLNRHRQDENLTVLDVRGDEEYRQGFIPGAEHIFVPRLEENLDRLDRDRAIATYCGSGYRASIAASILQKSGFDRVINVPGSWIAWKQENLPIEKPEPREATVS
ncbi:rhodanese-like domain-containing protein [Pannus brasiliensis CCIBt3594]|uniref:Rhodanese-like domain-containing protein n=1 Tax=Pannus brasiliensis CCIBt3594 TaxID=1427578 RepID=A0AAW9QRA4_9CHRO